MRKLTTLLALGFLCCKGFAATTLYIVTPEESNVDNPNTLSATGLNHSLLLPHYLYTHLLQGTPPSSIYFLTANPEYMRTGSPGCEDPMNENYLSDPTACSFDTTAFATLDPSVIYYDKLIYTTNPNNTTPQKLYPSSEDSIIDTSGYTNLKNDLANAESQGYATIVMSWPRSYITNVVSALGCSTPGTFTASAGQILKLTLTGTTCSTISLTNDGLSPVDTYPNYMNQNSSVTGTLASATNKYIIFVRHGEKWDNDQNGGELTCLGLNRTLAVPYYFTQKYGHPDVIMGASLTAQMAPPTPSPIPLTDDYASRALEKIIPYAVMNGISIQVLPLNLAGNQLEDSINTLINTPNNHLIVFGWESANAARIADAIILNSWNIPVNTNNPFYWNGNDYDQNIVLHYRCNSGGTSCVLQNDYFLNDEDYGDILPNWCGNPANS